MTVLGSSKKKREKQAAMQMFKKKTASIKASDLLPCLYKMAQA